jgi:hypothetical protein
MSMRTRPDHRRVVAIGLGLAVVLAACGGAADEPASGPPTTAPEGAVEATVVALDTLTVEVETALADAAVRFAIPEQEIAVAGALRVVWSDGSLGCPEDGVMYTQALVDGYLLTLEVAGDRVAYHGADGQPPFLCEVS